MKLTKTQEKIIKLMYEGYILLIHRDDDTGRIYYMVSQGFTNIYFRGDVFSKLLANELIYQQLSHPFDYVLTSLGEEIASKLSI
jgi:hypothetical protein